MVEGCGCYPAVIARHEAILVYSPRFSDFYTGAEIKHEGCFVPRNDDLEDAPQTQKSPAQKRRAYFIIMIEKQCT
jgi:hypothetical protein